MTRRKVLRTGTLVWAVLGAAVAFSALGDTSADVRMFVGLASVIGPLLAVWAAVQLSSRADRSAGILLVLSGVLTPTYFAYVINLPALAFGVALVAAPHLTLPDSSHRTAGDRA